MRCLKDQVWHGRGHTPITPEEIPRYNSRARHQGNQFLPTFTSMAGTLETQSAIPKVDGASSFDQLRNISKVLELIVLDKLRAEIPTLPGGMKGSGTNHFLLDCLGSILRALDHPETSVSLLSIDFSKAFNWMSRSFCLLSLADLGASADSIAMVYTFLKGRKMRFKVNVTLSSQRRVKGGSPQGTKLGNLLFVITINTI